MPQEQASAYRSLADSIKDEVAEIEASRPMTQSHYGRYMSILSQFVEKRPQTTVQQWGLVLMLAGANEQGVRSAVKLLT